jgi:hypothetical protein
VFEIQLPEPIAGKKIVAAMNSASKQLEGVGFVYTPHQVYLKGETTRKQWFYENLEIIVSSLSLEVRADGLERIEAENEYSTVTFSPEGEAKDFDSNLVKEVFDRFSAVFQSELKKPLSEIVPSPQITTEKEKITLPQLSKKNIKRIEDGAIRILAIVQGEYGERIANNIKNNGPSKWEVRTIEMEKGLPALIDDPEEFLPPDIPKADILLAIQEESAAAQLIVDIARAAQVRGVIAPIDNSEWLPEGMMNQIKRELEKMGVESVFPRPFCTLEETGSKLLDQFVECFGKPKLDLEWENGRVTRVEIKRDAACGCANYVAKQLVGVSTDDAVEKAGLIHHHYPCLASMKVEKDLEDTLMHVSGLQIKKAVDKILEPERKKKAVYIDPDMF